jgi:putative effector of murein hydrolase LrgA (UPF0299 family)
MHTIKIVLGGLLLLVVCLSLGRWMGGSTPAATPATVRWFLVLWGLMTLANLWVGVSKAGYWLKDEIPVALLVFVVPAIAAIVIRWRLSSH